MYKASQNYIPANIALEGKEAIIRYYLNSITHIKQTIWAPNLTEDLNSLAATYLLEIFEILTPILEEVAKTGRVDTKEILLPGKGENNFQVEESIQTIPKEGMPWNIPGGVHSPEAVSAAEFITRDALYHMTQGEDGYALHLLQTKGANPTPSTD